MKPLAPELQKKLQAVADEHQAVIISFIAPDDPIRTSPASLSSASIEPREMYKLEETICAVAKKQLPKKMHLIVQTPGGDLFTSFKIANYLRSKFEEIHAFVPYQAASGGTLLCCAANKITIGELGNLTPIDPQIRYQDMWLSAYAYVRSVQQMQQMFGELSPREVSSPWQQMAEKLDPVIYDEMNTVVWNSAMYANGLLQRSGYEKEKARSIAFGIARTEYNHSHCLMKEDVKQLGFNVVEENDIIECYKQLVSTRLTEKSDRHVIDCISPTSPQLSMSSTPSNPSASPHGQEQR